MFDNQNPDQSPKELIEGLYKAFESFRRKMEDPSYIQIEGAIKQLMENQNEMKASISDLKQKLLNPYDGIVVETKKNTEFRESQEELETILQIHAEKIQCVIGKKEFLPTLPTSLIPFGEAQVPTLLDYADGVDTFAFLLAL